MSAATLAAESETSVLERILRPCSSAMVWKTRRLASPGLTGDLSPDLMEVLLGVDVSRALAAGRLRHRVIFWGVSQLA